MRTVVVRNPEPDRGTVRANGIVVDVIANEDGSVFVEFYAYEPGRQAVVQEAHIDRYTDRHPTLRLDWAEDPKSRPCAECGHPEEQHDCCPLRCFGCGDAFTYHTYIRKEVTR